MGFSTFYEGRCWALPALPELAQTAGSFYEKRDTYSVDARGLADCYAYSTIKHLGAGQYYLMTTKDNNGRALDGARDYRLNVPANAPVKQYWSATLVPPRHTRPHPRRPSAQPLLAVAGPAEESRRLGGSSTLLRKRRPASTRIGCQLALEPSSKFCSVSTGPTRRSSRRNGFCRTSRR